MSHWYLRQAGFEAGPFQFSDLERMYEKCELHRRSEVRPIGSDRWRTVLETAVEQWAEVLDSSPDPEIVVNPELRSSILATGLPWRVRDRRTKIEMLLVPPGRFVMGASVGDSEAHDSELAPRIVTLASPYYLARYPVTQQQYAVVMGRNPSWFPKIAGAKDIELGFNGYISGPDGTMDRQRDEWFPEWLRKQWIDARDRLQGAGEIDLPAFDARQDGEFPVDLASFEQAVEFCAEAGFRLPTDVEWEFACRAGTSGPRYGEADQIGWHFGNSGRQTRPVGLLRPNDLGFHDLLGNVAEIVMDWDEGLLSPAGGRPTSCLVFERRSRFDDRDFGTEESSPVTVDQTIAGAPQWLVRRNRFHLRGGSALSSVGQMRSSAEEHCDGRVPWSRYGGLVVGSGFRVAKTPFGVERGRPLFEVMHERAHDPATTLAELERIVNVCDTKRRVDAHKLIRDFQLLEHLDVSITSADGLSEEGWRDRQIEALKGEDFYDVLDVESAIASVWEPHLVHALVGAVASRPEITPDLWLQCLEIAPKEAAQAAFARTWLEQRTRLLNSDRDVLALRSLAVHCLAEPADSASLRLLVEMINAGIPLLKARGWPREEWYFSEEWPQNVGDLVNRYFWDACYDSARRYPLSVESVAVVDALDCALRDMIRALAGRDDEEHRRAVSACVDAGQRLVSCRDVPWDSNDDVPAFIDFVPAALDVGSIELFTLAVLHSPTPMYVGVLERNDPNNSYVHLLGWQGPTDRRFKPLWLSFYVPAFLVVEQGSLFARQPKGLQYLYDLYSSRSGESRLAVHQVEFGVLEDGPFPNDPMFGNRSVHDHGVLRYITEGEHVVMLGHLVGDTLLATLSGCSLLEPFPEQQLKRLVALYGECSLEVLFARQPFCFICPSCRRPLQHDGSWSCRQCKFERGSLHGESVKLGSAEFPATPQGEDDFVGVLVAGGCPPDLAKRWGALYLRPK